MTCRLAVSLFVVFTACGGSPSSPSLTIPPMFLTIVPDTALLKIGQTETFSPFAVFPDGSGRPIAARWSIDNTTVATVQESGMVAAVGPGLATLIATADRSTASRSLRVIPEYAGTWEGQARIVQCLDGGPGSCTPGPCPTLGVCPPIYAPGRISRVLAVLNHRDENVVGFVQGDEYLPTIPSAGVIELAGTLALQGQLGQGEPPNRYEYQLVDWRTTIDPAAGMRGMFMLMGPSFTNRTTPPPRIFYQITSLRRTGPPLRIF